MANAAANIKDLQAGALVFPEVWTRYSDHRSLSLTQAKNKRSRRKAEMSSCGGNVALAEIWLFFPHEQATKFLFIETQAGYKI